MAKLSEKENYSLVYKDYQIQYGKIDTNTGEIVEDKSFYELYRREHRNVDLMPLIGKRFPSNTVELFHTPLDILTGETKLAFTRKRPMLQLWVKKELATEKEDSYIIKGKDANGVMTEVRLPKFEYGVAVHLETQGKMQGYLRIDTSELKPSFATERLFFECKQNGRTKDLSLSELRSFVSSLQKQKKKAVCMTKEAVMGKNEAGMEM